MWDWNLRPPADEGHITPNCLVKVKDVNSCAQQSMSKHLAVGTEFCQFRKKSDNWSNKTVTNLC